MHDPFPSPSLRFRPTTESPVISSVARSIKLFRACCTRAAGACAFQRGAAAGAPPRPHQHLSSVYFPMISPPFHQPSLPLFLFSFLRFLDQLPLPRGGCCTRFIGNRVERSKHSNYPFENECFARRLLSGLRLFSLCVFVFRSGLSLGRETRCGNKGWLFFCFLVPVVTC